MLTEFTTPLVENKEQFKELVSKHKEELTYASLLNLGFQSIDNRTYDFPCYKGTTLIDSGEYQGTMVFVTPGGGYQPYEHYITYVSYGSCSGCDTLQAIIEYQDNNELSDEKLEQLFTLVLHMFQRMIKFPSYSESVTD